MTPFTSPVSKSYRPARARLGRVVATRLILLTALANLAAEGFDVTRLPRSTPVIPADCQMNCVVFPRGAEAKRDTNRLEQSQPIEQATQVTRTKAEAAGAWGAENQNTQLQQPNDPRIDLIQRVNNLITLHFGTEAGRTYVVQFREASTAGKWSELYTIRASPFPNHYIIADPLSTNTQRFYRLAVSP